jgi:two-component system NarL family response regulator
MLLTVEDDIEVVGEARDGVAATELAASTAPDVILMDVRMPKRSGIEACLAIKEVAPTARIITARRWRHLPPTRTAWPRC